MKVKHVFILLLNKELYKIVYKHNGGPNLGSFCLTLNLPFLRFSLYFRSMKFFYSFFVYNSHLEFVLLLRKNKKNWHLQYKNAVKFTSFSCIFIFLLSLYSSTL